MKRVRNSFKEFIREEMSKGSVLWITLVDWFPTDKAIIQQSAGLTLGLARQGLF